MILIKPERLSLHWTTLLICHAKSFGFTISNLTSQTQNAEASRSSIEDADFAAEAADLAKNQILAQSATAMLAQASAISQNILGLLR